MAASSRSLMVRRSADRREVMEGGYCHWNTVSEKAGESHTPPRPSPEASAMPDATGVNRVSSRTCVGRSCKDWRRVRRSAKVDSKSVLVLDRIF